MEQKIAIKYLDEPAWKVIGGGISTFNNKWLVTTTEKIYALSWKVPKVRY